MKESFNKKPKIDNSSPNKDIPTSNNDDKIYNDYTQSRGSLTNETEKWEEKVQKNSIFYKHAEKKGTTNLPAGFFDDHSMDSKVRGVMYIKPKDTTSKSVLAENQPTSTVIASAPPTVVINHSLDSKSEDKDEGYKDIDDGIEDIIINTNSIEDQMKLAEMEQTAYMMKIKEIYDKIHKTESNLTDEDKSIINELLGNNTDITQADMEEEDDSNKETISAVSSSEISEIMKQKKKLRNERRKKNSGIKNTI